MKEKRYGTLKGLTVPVMTYSSYDEADKAAGVANAMLEVGNDNLHYRGGPAAATREFICDLLEEKTGLKRKTKPTGKKDDKGQDILTYDESEGEFAGRVCATKGWEDLKAFQADVDKWAATADEVEVDGKKVTKPLAVDSKEPERKPKQPPKLAQRYKDVAVSFLSGKKDLKKLNAALQKTLNKQFTALAGVPATDEKNVEALGWLCKEYQDAQDAFGSMS